MIPEELGYSKDDADRTLRQAAERTVRWADSNSHDTMLDDCGGCDPELEDCFDGLRTALGHVKGEYPDPDAENQARLEQEEGN